MTAKFFEKLSNNYLELLEDEEDFNVIIKIGEAPNAKVFQAHSAILKHRSLYFHNELKIADKDENNIKTIKLKNISIQQFEILIKYIYGGITLLENLETSFIFELMLVAYDLILEDMAKYLETFLIESNAHWLRLHFVRIHQESFQNDKFIKLHEWCNDILVKYPNKIFESEYFTSLQENALISLIKRDDLQMEEVKIWNYIIKWGIAQNPDLSFNPEDWSNENFLALKSTLKNCLPLIRYFQMSGDDIHDHIQPYKKIIEENLWNDLVKRHMTYKRPISSVVLPPRLILTQKLPYRSTESFSNIINEEHAAEIASWIDKKSDTYCMTNNPYEFKLLLCGSRDGFTRDSFWNLCDKQKNLVIVIKVKDTDEILGGYNPVGWDQVLNYDYKSCEECFTFSLKNGSVKASILSRVRNIKKALYCSKNCGPSFTCCLYMYSSKYNNRCYCFRDTLSYQKLIREKSTYVSSYSFFSVEEYEIFQIHEKTI